jgi:hypothetical protein
MVEPDSGQGAVEGDARGLPWWALGCAGLALVIFVVVGVAVFPVLAAMLFPPEPPVPAGAIVTEHESVAYGFDTWAYTVPGDGCAVLVFYDGNGGRCVREAGHCGADGDRRSALAGTCEGVTTFSRFAMRWEAEVWDYPAGVEVMTSREIAWTR